MKKLLLIPIISTLLFSCQQKIEKAQTSIWEKYPCGIVIESDITENIYGETRCKLVISNIFNQEKKTIYYINRKDWAWELYPVTSTICLDKATNWFEDENWKEISK